jgi:hypothetical protein
VKAGLLALAVLTTTGCASVAPKYASLPDNINLLRDVGAQPVRLGQFTADPASQGKVEQLSIRGGEYHSPYGDSFVLYLQEALRQDLEGAKLLSPTGAVEVAGVVIKNELDTGMDKGSASIEARFLVRRGAEVRFDKVKSATFEWESSFVGAIAIPRSQQNYPVAVQKLYSQLYADPAFQAALKP